MFERFTDATMRVMALAEEEVVIRDHSYVGTEHILLGIAREAESAGAQALAALDISLAHIVEKVDAVSPPEPRLKGTPPLTPNAKRVVEFALRESVVLGEREVRPEHLLVGIMRKDDSMGAQLLSAWGLDLDLIREAVRKAREGTR